ncbi:MAG: hypothetical protein RL272_177 [Candidatus Parcubacteria bacterium]|jgi:hypothetical protein
MKTFVLFGIDKYHHGRALALVVADDVADAARKFGGMVRDVRVVGENDPYRLTVDRGQECATFTPGPCTDEVLAAATGPADAASMLTAYYRYGTDNVYRQYLLGTLPTVR